MSFVTINNLPRLQLLFGLTNIFTLKGFDIDSNLGNNVDFDYYSIDQLNNSRASTKRCARVLHNSAGRFITFGYCDKT